VAAWCELGIAEKSKRAHRAARTAREPRAEAPRQPRAAAPRILRASTPARPARPVAASDG
jgi:hypothetical protein